MKPILSLSILLALAACKPGNKVISDNDWTGYDYSYFCPAYCFSETGKLSRPLDILNPNHLSLAPEHGKKAIAEARKYIVARGGMEFSDHVFFYNIDITSLDSIDHFKHKSPFYKLEKCGQTKYFVRFLFKPLDKTEYRFGIALNEQFQVISKPVFPDGAKRPDFHKIISPTYAIDSAKKKHQSLIEPVESIELIYAENLDCFVWEIVSERKFKNDPHGFKSGYAHVNAHTGKIIDWGKEKGIVTITPAF